MFIMLKHLIAGIVILLPVVLNAAPQSDAVPGGIILLPIDGNHVVSSARYNEKRLASIELQGKPHLLVGIPLSSKPGKHSVSIKNTSGKTTIIPFQVNDKTYQSQHLTIKNKRKVNPYANDMPRILAEKKRKNTARKLFSEQSVNAEFIVPVEGRISSIFGLRRFFNEQPRRPHSGLDIAAPEGTPVRAVANGRVIEAGDFFFSGNLVYLDHGQGLISMYAHLHELNVKTGDEIKQGQVIGSVGETGRVTGPHLHLAVIANQTLVDPLLFLPQLEDKAAAYFNAK